MLGMNKLALTVGVVAVAIVILNSDASAKIALVRHTDDGYRVTYYTNGSSLSQYTAFTGYRYSLAPRPDCCGPYYALGYWYHWDYTYTFYPYTYAHYPYAYYYPCDYGCAAW